MLLQDSLLGALAVRRAARGWAALRTPSRVLLAVGGAQHAALLHDRGPSKFLRQTAPQLELTGAAGLVVQVIWGLCWVASRTLGTLDQR